MKKKLLAAVLTIAIACGLATPAFARKHHKKHHKRTHTTRVHKQNRQ
jgi:hypothetical protein